MDYTEIKKDLFKMDDSYALAHCVSADFAMGAGIAKVFRNKYPHMPEAVKKKGPKIGDAVIYKFDSHLIFNLITKEKYWHKPTYQTFEASIRSLKKEMVSLGLTKLAIPQLAAGLDRLDWEKNRAIIQHVFRDTDVDIVVCLFK